MEKDNLLKMIGSYNHESVLYSDNYKFTQENAHILHKPIFSIKNSKSLVNDITYRKINDWDKKKLVSGSRENKEAGWRKFSIIEMIKLNIISDLRKIGLNTDKIKSILSDLSDRFIVSLTIDKKIKYQELEHSIFSCLNGNKILLTLDEEGNSFLLDENGVITAHFHFDGSETPILILPFYNYVKKIFKAMKKDIKLNKDSSIENLFSNNLTDREIMILEIIKNEEYEEILIKKSDKESLLINAKSRKNGNISNEDIISIINNGDYQNVTIVTNKGKKVALIKEDKFKI